MDADIIRSIIKEFCERIGFAGSGISVRSIRSVSKEDVSLWQIRSLYVKTATSPLKTATYRKFVAQPGPDDYSKAIKRKGRCME